MKKIPNNLTDKEIKKVLEDFIKYSDYAEDIEVGKNALDLINRQDQTIAILQSENESLKAEVERLKNAYKQCAWERDIFAEDMKEEIKKDCSYLMLDIKTIKAEAYKEFAERLKNEFPKMLNRSESAFSYLIDNLLNELVG